MAIIDVFSGNIAVEASVMPSNRNATTHFRNASDSEQNTMEYDRNASEL
jgi:hypothetical protein